jgi:hypothetical protein
MASEEKCLTLSLTMLLAYVVLPEPGTPTNIVKVGLALTVGKSNKVSGMFLKFKFIF